MSFKTLNNLNYGAAMLHGIQALIVICLIPHLNQAPGFMTGVYSIQKTVFVLRYPENPTPKCDLPLLHNLSQPGGLRLEEASLSTTTTNFNRFADTFAIPHNFFVGYVDVRYLIFSFFLLSCLFQVLDGWSGTYSTQTEGPRLLRFVEYSFSASVMLLAIALQMGIVEVYTLSCMFALLFATNILGLIAESLVFMVESSRDLLDEHACQGLFMHPMYWWTIPHFLSWGTCLVAYAPLLDAYLTSTNCSERSPPGFVNVIVFLEFFLFVCFGFVQLYSLYYKTWLLLHMHSAQHKQYDLTRAKNLDDVLNSTSLFATEDGKMEQGLTSGQITHWADHAYVILSFTAKTLLGWLILGPTL